MTASHPTAASLDELYGRLTAATAGQRVPCEGRDEWTSRRAADRAVAAARCHSCPALAACRRYAAAAAVTFGVWAGEDRTPRPIGRPPRRRADAVPAAIQRAERLEVTRQLTAAGSSAWEIAVRLGVTEQSVYTYRRALRSATS